MLQVYKQRSSGGARQMTERCARAKPDAERGSRQRRARWRATSVGVLRSSWRSACRRGQRHRLLSSSWRQRGEGWRLSYCRGLRAGAAHVGVKDQGGDQCHSADYFGALRGLHTATRWRAVLVNELQRTRIASARSRDRDGEGAKGCSNGGELGLLGARLHSRFEGAALRAFARSCVFEAELE